MKKCRQCKQIKSIVEFVDTSGTENPRGHYCKTCHQLRLEDEWLEALALEESKTSKLEIVYGDNWQDYALPGDFQCSLYDERDICPYCGDDLPPMYLGKSETQQPFRGRAHLDHMDPLAYGGEDSICNVIYVCDACNIKKGDTLFVDWLEKLEPCWREISIYFYIEKHTAPPSIFVPSKPTKRETRLNGLLMLSEEKLKVMFPEPIGQ